MEEINLIKLETLSDAENPQEDKYPSGKTVATGLMWDFSKPRIDEPFFVLKSKLNPSFKTSIVKSIDKVEDGYIITTINSKYKIQITGKDD